MKFQEEKFLNEIEKLEAFWSLDIRFSSDETVKRHDIYAYPDYDELYDSTIRVCDILGEIGILPMTVSDVLRVMAYTNETEDMLDYADECMDLLSLNVLVEQGYKFSLRDARWQIAELVGRKKREAWYKYLILLKEDADPSVAKRAKNALEAYQVT